MNIKILKNKDRGIKTANLKLPIHHRLLMMKVDRAGVGLSELIEELLDFYEDNHQDVQDKDASRLRVDK